MCAFVGALYTHAIKMGKKNPEINQLKKSTLTETNNQIPKLRVVVVVVLLVLAYGG